MNVGAKYGNQQEEWGKKEKRENKEKEKKSQSKKVKMIKKIFYSSVYY